MFVDGGERRKDSGLALVVLVVALLVYLPTVSRTAVNTDPAANSLAAWRLAQTGKPWMNGLDLTEEKGVSHFGIRPDGRIVTTRTPGQILVAVPFYLGSDRRQAQWSFAPGGMAAAVVTALAMALLFVGLLRAGVPRRRSIAVTAVVAFGTPIWTVSADALWPHCLTVMALAAAIVALVRHRLFLAGLALGVGMLARPQFVVVVVLVALGLALTRRSARPALAIGAGSAIVLGLLCAWSRWVFLTWDPLAAYTLHDVVPLMESKHEDWGNYVVSGAGFLISPDRGLFVWTPLLLLLLPALVRTWTTLPDWSRWLTIGGVGYSASQLLLNPFHGGDAFYGYRLALELLIAATPAYAMSLGARGQFARWLTLPITAAQMAAMLMGATLFGLVRPESRVWTDNALWFGLRTYPESLGVAFALAVGGVVAAMTYTGHFARRREADRVSIAR